VVRRGYYKSSGFKNSKARLHSTKYIKYVYGDKVACIKEKAYVSACDGYYTRKLITEKTYNAAIKRGYKHNIIDIPENMLDIPKEALEVLQNYSKGSEGNNED